MDFVKGLANDVQNAAQKIHATVTKHVSKAKARSAAFADVRPAETSRDYQESVHKAIPGRVHMFSGCMDSQTSADVSDVSSFGLPAVTGPEKAGGACTNALLSVHQKVGGSITFGSLLIEMQKVLKSRRYTQVPQLSSSQQMDLKSEPFQLMNPSPNGRTKSLLIGINYIGHAQGELSGCVNDVKQMRNFIISHGFSSAPDRMRVLTDERGVGEMPTGKNIIAAMKWLVEDCRPGDSLFFHYSGHGGQIPDDNGDEEDGMDETLIPVDYASSGQIRDDDIFKLLVAPLKEGVTLVAVFDCCHSGTILDLPYIFTANDSGCHAIGTGSVSGLAANPFFSLTQALKMAAEAAEGILRGLTGAARSLLK